MYLCFLGPQSVIFLEFNEVLAFFGKVYDFSLKFDDLDVLFREHVYKISVFNRKHLFWPFMLFLFL